jgi:hypothetical protein
MLNIQVSEVVVILVVIFGSFFVVGLVWVGFCLLLILIRSQAVYRFERMVYSKIKTF